MVFYMFFLHLHIGGGGFIEPSTSLVGREMVRGTLEKKRTCLMGQRIQGNDCTNTLLVHVVVHLKGVTPN